MTIQDNYDRVLLWEKLWGNYIDKLARIDELKSLGRYGYQLRMPRVALRKAADALKQSFPVESKQLHIF